MFWREVDLNALTQASGFFWWKRPIERGGVMGIEIIHHQDDFFGVRIVRVKQIPQKMSKILSGASCFGFDHTLQEVRQSLHMLG